MLWQCFLNKFSECTKTFSLFKANIAILNLKVSAYICTFPNPFDDRHKDKRIHADIFILCQI